MLGWEILLVVAILFFLSALTIRAIEPSYKGEGLSLWIAESDGEARQEAIRHIGTNGIPTLLDILSVKKRGVKRLAARLSNKALADFSDEDADMDVLRGWAVRGFAALGTNAEPAIPRLARMLDEREVQLMAARALSKIGPNGFSVLTNALATKNAATRNDMIFAMGQEGGADTKVIAALLINSLKDADWAVRGNAAIFMAGRDPGVAVPVLIAMLDDKDYYVRDGAIGALQSYGSAAASAAPKLLSMYTNVISGKDKDVALVLGTTILQSLRKIDRKAAGEAEAFLVNTGPLNSARTGQTITLLSNGQQLIAGGDIYTEVPTKTNHIVSQAELMDPATGKWTETGEMHTARYGHVAVLLRNGKVLVAGGADSLGRALASAEIYDPETKQWKETGMLTKPHRGGKAILQSNGKVLVFSGGWTPAVPRFDEEVYDVAAGTWTEVTNGSR